VVLEIRTGGDGFFFASEIFRMYARFAGPALEVVLSPVSRPSAAEVIAIIEGQRIYSRLKYRHPPRARVPETEQQGASHLRRHRRRAPRARTWTSRSNQDLRITPSLFRPRRQALTPRTRSAHPHPTNTAVPAGRREIKNREKAMRVLRSRLYDLERERQQAALAKERRAQVGTGDRSEKIRTYNFPQNRVTDHRIGLTLHRLQDVLDGELDRSSTRSEAARAQAAAGSRRRWATREPRAGAARSGGRRERHRVLAEDAPRRRG
jgi:peptide chain release factor 1